MKNRARKKCLTECPGKRGRIIVVRAQMEANALEVSMALKLYIKRTNLRTLDIVPLEILKKFAIDLN